MIISTTISTISIHTYNIYIHIISINIISYSIGDLIVNFYLPKIFPNSNHCITIYPLVICYIAMFFDGPFNPFIDGLPINSMVIFHGELLVITRWLLIHIEKTMILEYTGEDQQFAMKTNH